MEISACIEGGSKLHMGQMQQPKGSQQQQQHRLFSTTTQMSYAHIW